MSCEVYKLVESVHKFLATVSLTLTLPFKTIEKAMTPVIEVAEILR